MDSYCHLLELCCWLNTHPVHDVVVMQEGHALQQHHHVTFDLSGGQRVLRVPDDLRQVRQHEVEDQDEAGPMGKDVLQLYHLKRSRRRWRWSHAAVTSDLHPERYETHMLVVLDLLQGFDFPQSLVGDPVLQLPQSHFLQRHRLSGLTRNAQKLKPVWYQTDWGQTRPITPLCLPQCAWPWRRCRELLLRSDPGCCTAPCLHNLSRVISTEQLFIYWHIHSL